uniref:Uncharacterized protein n=1 Tax=Anguilla anguilla TaxID=7936 RepID=A0A0E9PSE4_ANGAN
MCWKCFSPLLKQSHAIYHNWNLAILFNYSENWIYSHCIFQ